MGYKNFGLAIYCTAPFLNRISIEELKNDFKFFQRYLHVDKVYLETHRGKDDVSKEKMINFKNFFESEGIIVAGGITTTIDSLDDPVHDLRIFHTFCYSKDSLKKRLQEIVEYTASLFDEIILDDFYFTSCSCEDCIKSKGDKSWQEYRLNLMTEVSQKYVVDPAKRVNPKVNMIIKYPNWVESYHENGYNPETQKDIFDEIYVGTETRDPKYTQQDLPRYLSYYLMRWFENVKPSKNKGGWFDSFECNLNQYLEQAYLTLFAKAKEITLFDFNSLRNTVYIPPLGFELERLDNILSLLGDPMGVRVYHPFHSDGEDHLVDYLGMIGIPFEPSPYFSFQESPIFITETSCGDRDILNKMKKALISGNTIIITSGVLRRLRGKGIEEFTSVRYTDRKVNIDFFAIDSAMIGFTKYVHSQEILFPVLEYYTNSSWPVVVGIKGERNFPILLKDFYGSGKLYVLNVPDNFFDVYNLPVEVLNEIRKIFMEKIGIYFEGEGKISLFLYNNNYAIVESFLPHRSEITLRFKDKSTKILLNPNGFKLINLSE
ncbi:permease [Dictyoglomus thermophilum]|uniref:permease n=1 Tax=Dictyoglomus thermophilum TaxID=14 RepID=UPI0011EA9CFE|nr:permease [Dictyoglomus thermophilum]TYT23306.1 permease [Dictyoglomus thermophilum]